VVFGIAGKPIHLGYDKGLNLTLVLPAKLYGPQKLGSVGCFGRSSLLTKQSQHLNAFIPAVVATNLFLKIQGSSFYLLIA
jgi:hypothetical protein